MIALVNLEAEQAVLGALLFRNALCEHLSALEPEHFYDPVHGRIYSAARGLIQSGRVADGTTLKAFFEQDTGIKQIGGVAYLMKLMESAAPLTAQAVSYAALIRDLAARRSAKLALSDALARLSSDDDLLTILAESEAAVRAVTESGDADCVDASEASAAFMESMDTPSLATGIRALDERLGGLHRGDLYILAGRPSMGKTALADQIARNVAEGGKAVHFASLEMPKEQLACRAMSALSFRRHYGIERIEYYHLRRGSNVSRDAIRALAADVPRSLIIDDRAAQTLAQLEMSARTTRRRLKRLDLIVVDYLQLMKASRADRRVNEVSEISQGLKAIAKRLDCPVLALSQLSRGVEGRENKRPTLSDLRDSGAIEQDADAVLACYREAYYLERNEPSDADDWRLWRTALERVKREMEVTTLKQRAGPIGTDRLEAWLEYDVIRDRMPA